MYFYDAAKQQWHSSEVRPFITVEWVKAHPEVLETNNESCLSNLFPFGWGESYTFVGFPEVDGETRWEWVGGSMERFWSGTNQRKFHVYFGSGATLKVNGQTFNDRWSKAPLNLSRMRYELPRGEGDRSVIPPMGSRRQKVYPELKPRVSVLQGLVAILRVESKELLRNAFTSEEALEIARPYLRKFYLGLKEGATEADIAQLSAKYFLPDAAFVPVGDRLLLPDLKRALESFPASQRAHLRISCDVTEMSPIVGQRWTKRGENYDLCESAFAGLPEEEKAKFDLIAFAGATPVPYGSDEEPENLRASLWEVTEKIIKIQLELAKAADTAMLVRVIEENRVAHRESFTLALESIYREPSCAAYLARVAEVTELVATRAPSGRLRQTAADLPTLFEHAAAVEKQYNALMAALATAVGGEFHRAALKSAVRVYEKVILQEDPADRTRFDTVCDVVRGGQEFDSTAILIQAFELLLACDVNERSRAKLQSGLLGAECGKVDIVIVRIKDRFNNPNDSGYADTMVNFYFASDPNKHICEVQLMHTQLTTIRRDQGAHKFNNRTRSAVELLEATGRSDAIPASESISLQPPRDNSQPAHACQSCKALKEELATVKADMESLKSEVRAEMAAMRTEMDAKHDQAEKTTADFFRRFALHVGRFLE